MWRVNWPIVIAFMAVSGQLSQIVLPNGRLLTLGFRYGDVRAGLEMASIALTPVEWRGFQVMEAEAASVLNRR